MIPEAVKGWTRSGDVVQGNGASPHFCLNSAAWPAAKEVPKVQILLINMIK